MAEKKANVQSVDRALAILDLFKTNASLSLIEITQKMALPKTTVFGLIATLEKRNYLQQQEGDGRYRPGIALVELSWNLANHSDVVKETERLLTAVAVEKMLCAHITALNGMEVVYLKSISAHCRIGVNTVVGSRAPANCTAAGKAFLAFLPEQELEKRLAALPGLQRLTPHSITDMAVLRGELQAIRERGYSVDDQESIPGIRGVSLPVCNLSGFPVVGMSLCSLVPTMTPELVAGAVSAMRGIARRLSGLMGNKVTV